MAHARFETFAMVPDEVAEHRRRLMIGALAAATLSMALGLTSWTANKLGITRVAPPKNSYSVTLQVLEPPPPPAPPPAAPAAATTQAEDRPADSDEPVPPEPDDPPTEVVPIDLDARPRASVPVPTGLHGSGKGGSGVPGVPGIGSSCPLPPCIGTNQMIGRPVVPQPKTPAAEPVQAPIKAVMATSIFSPNPDQARLSRTATGRSHRRPGKTTVSFCIDGGGKTYDVRTSRRFPGDPEVDEICRSTVSKWRFSPQRVGGKARSTCSAVTFDIHFE